MLTHSVRNWGLWILSLWALGSGSLIGLHAASPMENQSSQADNLTPIATFASGAQFYLQKDTIKPLGQGRLQYYVVGQPAQQPSDGTTHPLTSNEVDCRTGRFKSATQTWNIDPKGNNVSTQTGSPYPVTLNPNSQLYQALKDACGQYAPEVKINW